MLFTISVREFGAGFATLQLIDLAQTLSYLQIHSFLTPENPLTPETFLFYLRICPMHSTESFMHDYFTLEIMCALASRSPHVSRVPGCRDCTNDEIHLRFADIPRSPFYNRQFYCVGIHHDTMRSLETVMCFVSGSI